MTSIQLVFTPDFTKPTPKRGPTVPFAASLGLGWVLFFHCFLLAFFLLLVFLRPEVCSFKNLEHFKRWKTFWKKNMWWKWHLYLHPRQCLIWMEPHILAQYLYETMKRDTCKMVHLPFVPKQWTNKTSICECLLQYGLEVKTSSPPCRRCGWIEVTFVERTGTLHGSTSYWDLTIAATVSNYICHSFMGSGQILLVQLAKQT